MTTKFQLIFLLVTSVGLVSCASWKPASYKGFPDRVLESETELGNLEGYFSTAMVAQYNNAGPDESKRQRIRNEIINGRIAAIDIQFSLFQQNLHEDSLFLNIGSDAILLGLGAAGALASGGASQILSATSAAVTGLNGSINKNAFYEQTMPALFAQMIAQRKKVLVKIRTGLASNSISYPLQQGFADLEDYQYAGSIPGSLATIVEDAGVTSFHATTELNKILVGKLDDIGEDLKYSTQGEIDPITGTFTPAAAQKIKACIKQAGLPDGTLFSDVLYDPKFKNEKSSVSECLKKP